jgi:LysR family hydrogen peroxide-inducible transcriptional activator
MNLRDLEYLIAIDEELHFNKAAERCFVSQPTLSGQLKKLEEELGVLLIERTNRQVTMTDVGKAVTNQARRVLAEARGIRDIAQSFYDPMAGEIHVGLIPTVAPYLLPLIMPAIKRQCPKLKLWLHEHQTHVLLDKLHNAELDLLILALPVDSNEFEEISLFEEAFWLAVPKGYPLATQDMITLDDLNNQEMLLLEEGHCLRGQALDVCFSAGAREQSGFQATSLETLRHMIGEGMGMTLMPELAINKRIFKADAIRYIPFKSPQPTRRIGMLYRKNTYRESSYRALGEVIRSLLVK